MVQSFVESGGDEDNLSLNVKHLMKLYVIK